MLNQRTSSWSSCRWCVPKQVSSAVQLSVPGSNIESCRPLLARGYLLADGWLDPSLHQSGFGDGRTVEVIQTRSLVSIIRLCALVRLVNTASSSHAGDGCVVCCDHEKFGGFSASMPLSKGRLLPALAPLGRAGALIAGGFDLDLSLGTIRFQALAESDLFGGSGVRATGKMRTARVGAVAVPLPDGTVLVTGGGSLKGEIFQPR